METHILYTKSHSQCISSLTLFTKLLCTFPLDCPGLLSFQREEFEYVTGDKSDTICYTYGYTYIMEM